MSVVVRWKFHDLVTSEVVLLPLNPNSMTSASEARNLSWAWGSSWTLSRMRGIDTPNDSAPSWTFSGVILAQSHDELLYSWAARLHRLQVDDHIGHSYGVVIQKYDSIEKTPTASHPFRANYTMTCLLLEDLS